MAATAEPPVGVKVVRRVSLRVALRRAVRPVLPRLQLRVWVPALAAVFEVRHQVLVFLPFLVVARWAIFPAPDTLTFEVTRTEFLVTLVSGDATVTEAVGRGGSGVGAMGETELDGLEVGPEPNSFAALTVKV